MAPTPIVHTYFRSQPGNLLRNTPTSPGFWVLTRLEGHQFARESSKSADLVNRLILWCAHHAWSQKSNGEGILVKHLPVSYEAMHIKNRTSPSNLDLGFGTAPRS